MLPIGARLLVVYGDSLVVEVGSAVGVEQGVEQRAVEGVSG